jgi:serine/threonine-protein kinase
VSAGVTSAPTRTIGRYALYDEIASGGMASVHIGRLMGPLGFSRTVAIKVLHPHHAKDPEFVRMFLDEARLAARIRHPNVVATLDVAVHDQELFLVMEYVHGETLAHLLRRTEERGQEVPPRVAAAILIDLLEGLHAAHDAKDELGTPLAIVHRDVSPQNLMVGRDGTARVLDFGVAKAASRVQSTRDGHVKGKFAYMAPEQVMRHHLDRRVDIFAASIVLWEALTGKRLFAADDPAAAVARIMGDVIVPPSALRAGLPEALDAVVLKGLARDREDRFATASEMARALESALEPVRSTAVAEWVRATAEDRMSARAERVATIEREAEPPSPARVSTPATEMFPVSLNAGDARQGGHGSDGVVRQAGGHPRLGRRSWPYYAIGVGLVVAGVAVSAPLLRASAKDTPSVATDARATSVAVPPPGRASASAPMPPPSFVTLATAVAPPLPTATPSVSAPSPRPSAHALASHAPKGCNPPYDFDSAGVKHFKPECL